MQSQKTNNWGIGFGEIKKFIDSPNFIILVLVVFCLLLLLSVYSMTGNYNQLVELYQQNCMIQPKSIGVGFFG